MKIFLIAAISILMSVCAQFSLKAGMSSSAIRATFAQSNPIQIFTAVASNKFIVLGFVLYGLGAIVWLSVLSHWEVSKAYPLVGSGFVLALMIGAALGEQVSILRICGALLICAGIFLVGKS